MHFSFLRVICPRSLQAFRNICFSARDSMADHLTTTAAQARHKIISPATVTEIQDLSQTVKLLKLRVQESHFTFKAGQWVDMFIPGVETVGGFSMCSAPDLLTSSRIFHLAIKFSKHPPAYWVHTKCREGDSVRVRSGGDFFYNAENLADSPDLLLLAGGVGINPLYSILLHFVCLLNNSQGTPNSRKAIVLFSARSQEELLFKEELLQLQHKHSDNIDIQLHCTKDTISKAQDLAAGHINQSLIDGCLQKMDRSKTEVFICGPLPFINAMESHCQVCQVPQSKIHYEKWW